MAYTLQADKHNIITLGNLRKFINNTCMHLANDIPIEIYDSDKQQAISKGITIIADESSIEFYSD